MSFQPIQNIQIQILFDLTKLPTLDSFWYSLFTTSASNVFTSTLQHEQNIRGNNVIVDLKYLVIQEH